MSALFKPKTFARSKKGVFPFNFLLDEKWVDRHQRVLLSALILLGILISAYMFVYYSRGPIFENPSGSWVIAENMVAGRGYSACASSYFPFCSPKNQTTAMREPVPVFLMSIAMMIYPSVISGLVLQSLLFLATLLVIYVTLKDYDRRVAFFAASLWVVSKPVFVQIGEDNGELAAALFLSLSLYFFLKGLAAPRRVLMWGLAGLFAGLGSLSRTVILGSSLGMAIVLFCVLFVKARRSPRLPLIHPAKPVFYFLLMFFIVYSPWVIRNRIVFGKTVIGSTLTGYNIYRMNYIVAQNDFSPHYVGPQDGHAAVAALLEARSLTGLENEAQMQGIYMEAGVEIIKAHPIQYIQLSLYRFLPLWFNASVNEAYGSDLSALDYVGLAEQAFLLVMVVLGAAGNWKKFWPFILVLFLGSAAYMAIDAQLRYLVDFMPVVVSLGALSLASLGLLNEPNNVLFDRSP